MTMDIKERLIEHGWLQSNGAFVISDGQFGSTGKGLASSVVAEALHDHCDLVTCNAGPNSGHTSYFSDEKIVLMQLPTFGVYALKKGSITPMHMNAGAILDLDRLTEETERYGRGFVTASPWAAVVTKEAKENEVGMHERLGSTGKGTGAALADKVMRKTGAVFHDWDTEEHDWPFYSNTLEPEYLSSRRVMIEVSQGFSLGLNKGFYPQCTSRDCGSAQAISDAGMHPNDWRSGMLVFRTYPIRVAGNSGPGYPDQEEITWESIGQEPELTTVTQKERRLFTWSREQFKQAIWSERPDHLFINFMNYLPREDHHPFVRDVLMDYMDIAGALPETVMLGHGPKVEDVEMVHG